MAGPRTTKRQTAAPSTATHGVLDPVIERWQTQPPSGFPNYAAGSWGPETAEALLARDGAAWRRPEVA